MRDRDPSGRGHEDAPKIHAFNVQPGKLGSSLANQCPKGKASCLLGDFSEAILLLRVSNNRFPRTNEETYDITMAESLPF